MAPRKPSATTTVGDTVTDTLLTHDQILHLHAQPIELVPAPGAGLATLYLGACFVLDNRAAPYSSPYPPAYTNVRYVGHPDGLSLSLSDEMLVAGRHIAYGGDTRTHEIPENTAIVLVNDQDYEWAGGDPANTLAVRVFSRVVDLA